MNRLVVLGAGESGLGAALLAKREGYDVFVSDGGSIGEARKAQLQTAGIEFEEGKHDEALEMYDKAISIFTLALGIDNRRNARAHHCIALAKLQSGDMAGALASAREAVRIFNNNAVTDATSQAAVDLLRKLEGGA